MPVNIFTALDDPSARTGAATDARSPTDPPLCSGVLDSAQSVALYRNTSAFHCCRCIPISGTYTTLDDPSAATGTTLAFGINAAGQVVGQYRNASGLHGFLL